MRCLELTVKGLQFPPANITTASALPTQVSGTDAAVLPAPVIQNEVLEFKAGGLSA